MQLKACLLGVLAGLGACQPNAEHRSHTMSTVTAPSPSKVAPSARAASRRVPVLDSFIAFQEVGEGPPLVLLHGNPLSSRVWNGVLPRVARHHRALAPDLVGMGASGKPDIPYRFADHARYLDAWFEALGLRDLVLVGYDWGGALAMDWAARHPERVRGLVVFETFLRPMQWSEWPPQGAELFRALRTPGVGEKMVLEENQFLARSLNNGIARSLTEAELAAYYEPYATRQARLPLLQWTREIPVDGEPADVVSVVTRYDGWLASSPRVPKLLLQFEPPPGRQQSPTGAAAMIDWARAHVSGLEIEELGVAGHHAPEDRPEEIAGAISAWVARHRL